MFTVLFYSHGSCHPKFKIKDSSSTHSWFSHPVTSGSNFYFYSPLQRELELKAGIEVLQFEQWVLYFPSGWSAWHQLSFLIFDTVPANIHLEFFTSVTFASTAGGASRMEAYACVSLSACGNRIQHLD